MTNVIDLQEQRYIQSVKRDIGLLRTCESFEEVLKALPLFGAEFRTELAYQMLASTDDQVEHAADIGAMNFSDICAKARLARAEVQSALIMAA